MLASKLPGMFTPTSWSLRCSHTKISSFFDKEFVQVKAHKCFNFSCTKNLKAIQTVHACTLTAKHGTQMLYDDAAWNGTLSTDISNFVLQTSILCAFSFQVCDAHINVHLIRKSHIFLLCHGSTCSTLAISSRYAISFLIYYS